MFKDGYVGDRIVGKRKMCQFFGEILKRRYIGDGIVIENEYFQFRQICKH